MKEDFSQIAGTYSVRSPYHKNTLLPFNIESDGYVSTLEYKGNTPYLHQGYGYSLKTLQDWINEGYLKPGKIPFPKNTRRNGEE